MFMFASNHVKSYIVLISGGSNGDFAPALASMFVIGLVWLMARLCFALRSFNAHLYGGLTVYVNGNLNDQEYISK